MEDHRIKPQSILPDLYVMAERMPPLTGLGIDFVPEKAGMVT
ncbi:hypothetical protein KP77_10570 [Jeotgalibacillus alimentarius]|uniref:Uncharacterized protein n=1 Tax=Jeotgalibacillus alimentarius TaxID=135826 RepID=A0A0C2RMT4_9BACL|nr:hypothetical protein KP77_10570 [Jeotgalibacillus alimentarius]